MADTSDSNPTPTPSEVSNRICSAIPLAENLLGQNAGNPCQKLFEERTSDSFTCKVQHPGTRAINGIRNVNNEKNLCTFDKMEIEYDSGLEKSVVGEGGADFSYTNGSECASDKDRSGSKGRSRRKPQYSLNKTELYKETSDAHPLNQNITDFQMYDQNNSPEIDGNESSMYIRRSMQKIKPQYVQVHQDSAYLHEQEGGNNVQVPMNSSSIFEQGVKEFADVHSEYSSVRENHEQHALVHQGTSSSFLQNGGYVQDSQFQNSTHEQHGEKYVDVHGEISSNLEQDSAAGYVHVHQDTNSNLEQGSDIETQKNQFECKECLITLFDFDLYTDHLMSHNANSQDSSSDDPSAHALDIEAPIGDFVGGSVHQPLSDSCSMESEGFLEIDLSSSKLERDENGEGREDETKMVEMMEGVMPGGEMKKKRGRKKKERETDSSLVKCPVCSKAFKTRNNLKTHLCKFHSEKKEILRDFFYKGESVKQKSVCTLCGKCFISKAALLRHLDTRHQGEAQVRCGVCNEIFETTELLFKHARLCHNRGKMGNHEQNTSEESSCSVVTKEKLDKNENHQTLSYVPHQIAASKTVMEPPLATLPREIQTTKGDPLMENTQLHHEGETNHSNYIDSEHVDHEGGSDEGQVEPQTSHYFQREIDVPSTDSLKSRDIYCGVCLLFFDSVEKFVVHCMASSECLSSKECPVCGKVINSSLKEHLKSHSDDRPYQCEICKASFKRNHQMKLHKQTVHSDIRLYHCELCQKSFKRRDKLTCHYRTHSDEHPFMCTECGSVFKWKHHLKRHRDNVHADKASQVKARRFPCEVCGNCFKWRHHLKRHLRNVHHIVDESPDAEDDRPPRDLDLTGSDASLTMAGDYVGFSEGGKEEENKTIGTVEENKPEGQKPESQTTRDQTSGDQT